ncbi:MAG: ubiquinone/menaquinone biosynthesis methyltransferase [Polyangiaceae bacterium]
MPHEKIRPSDERGTQVKAMFDRIAPTYDLLNRVMSVGIDRAWRARAIALLADAPEGAALDLCAGTMDLTAMLVRARPRCRVVAADFAAKMLEAGKVKAPRAEVVVADALELPFKDGEFTSVICGFGMRNLSDLARGIDEVRRVLAPGGVFVTLEFFRPMRATTRFFHTAYASHVLPTVGGKVSGDREAYAYLATSVKEFVSRVEYEDKLRDQGFSRVHGIDLTFGVASIVRGVK